MLKTSNPDKSIIISLCFKARYIPYHNFHDVLTLYDYTQPNDLMILSQMQFFKSKKVVKNL